MVLYNYGQIIMLWANHVQHRIFTELVDLTEPSYRQSAGGVTGWQTRDCDVTLMFTN